MKKGLLTTLIAAAISLTGATASFAAAPVIGSIPDVVIGDAEQNIGSDNNFFVFTNAFKFDDYVSDQDSTVSTLLWSFDEDNAPTSDTQGVLTPYYLINGKSAVHYGTTAIANDVATSNALHVNPTNEIRQGNVWASFRDIVFSPGGGSPPFPNPSSTFTAGTVAAHASGKMVRFYASDGTNVAKKDILVHTIDNTSDSLTGSFSYTTAQDDLLTDSAALGWSAFPQPGALRTEASVWNSSDTSLFATVSSDTGSNWATFGWITNGQNNTQSLTYANVGTGKIVRAKFFMYATGQTGAALNQIPSFRMRVANRFAITANCIVKTNLGSSGNNDLLVQDIAPVKTPLTPSVYKVDLDPTDTPRLVSNALNESFLRAFEVYDNANQVNGTISMTEGQIGTYSAAAVADASTLSPVTASTGLIKAWNGGANGGDFGQGSQQTAVSANWAGTIAKYTSGVFDTSGGQPVLTSNASGIYMDTIAVETDRLGIAAYDMFGGTDQYPQTTTTRQAAARVESGKLYKVKFHATATVNANRQPLIRFRAKSLSFDWTSTLEINGANAQGIGSNTYLISTEASPGVGNALPAADRILGDTTGGWYNVLLLSPLDTDIKASQPNLAAQDGPGVCTNAGTNNVARRDIQVGLDMIDDFGGVGSIEVGQIQLDKVQIQKFNAVN